MVNSLLLKQTKKSISISDRNSATKLYKTSLKNCDTVTVTGKECLQLILGLSRGFL